MTSTGRTRAGRQIMERPRSSAAPAAKAGGTVVGSTPSKWLETMPPVRGDQKRDRPGGVRAGGDHRRPPAPRAGGRARAPPPAPPPAGVGGCVVVGAWTPPRGTV